MAVSAQPMPSTTTRATTTRATSTHADARASRRTGGVRRCIASGEMRPKEALIRFVAAPDGTVVPDLAERLPGRGLWLTAQRDIAETARTKRLFGRTARRSVTAPEALADRLEAMLAKRCTGLLGLANRAGQLVAGFSQVRDWLRSGKAAILVIASDSLGRDAKELERIGRDLQLVRALTTQEMGSAIGRERIVHMAIAPGRLAGALEREAKRLAGFRAV